MVDSYLSTTFDVYSLNGFWEKPFNGWTKKIQKAGGPWCSAWEPTWSLAKVQKLHIHSLSQGVEIELIFALMDSGSWDWPIFIFKIARFGRETWPLAKAQGSRCCTYALFLPQGVEIELIFGLRAAISGIWPDFQNCHIWAWNLAIGQSARSCTYTLFLPQGVEIELIFALRAAISEIQANFQNCHIWAWNMAIGQNARCCTYTFYPRVACFHQALWHHC